MCVCKISFLHVCFAKKYSSDMKLLAEVDTNVSNFQETGTSIKIHEELNIYYHTDTMLMKM